LPTQIKPKLPFVLGSEFAGVVTTAGSQVKGLSVGDRVYGFLPYGAFAEQVCVHQFQVKKIPSASMSFAEATAFGTVYPTSYQGLVGRANLRSGETVRDFPSALNPLLY
jgi:NADPH:quinone reductase